MGICPSLDPQVRVLHNYNHSLKQILSQQLKDLRIYNFYTPVLHAINSLPIRYMYNEGILQDIDKLKFYAERKGVTSLQSRVSSFGQQNLFQEQIKNSCLILQNQIISEVQSKQFQQPKIKQEDQYDPHANHSNFQGILLLIVRYLDKYKITGMSLLSKQGTQSFQNNITRNESLVAQMNLIYGRQIKRQEYSKALKLFLKWVQYFNEHSYGGFLKTIYKAFCQSLYRLDKTQFQTLVDEVSIFVQYLVKVYTKVLIRQKQIYNLDQLNKSIDGKLFKNENVYNLIMSFMFRKTKIKGFIKTMIRQNSKQKIKQFQQKLKKHSKKGISRFGIDQNFVLIRNQEWEKKLKQLKIKNHKKQTVNYKSQQKISKNKNEGNEENKANSSMDQNNEENNEESKQQFLQSFKSRVQNSCYQKSIRLVSELCTQSESISPISKLKTIIRIAKSIQQQIEQFYTHQLNLPKSEIPELDPDNLTSIIMYLIVSNNNPIIFEELKMVQYFTTTNTLNCVSGYYLNIFVASMEMIIAYQN